MDSELLGIDITTFTNASIYQRDQILRTLIQFKWTFGTMDERLDQAPLFMPAPKAQDPEHPYLDLEHQQNSEEAVRQWLSTKYGLACFCDCGDVGLCFRCTRYPRSCPELYSGSNSLIDRYRPRGTLREATDEELRQIALSVWIDTWRQDGTWGHGSSFTTKMLGMNLKAEPGRLQAAIDQIQREVSR